MDGPTERPKTVLYPPSSVLRSFRALLMFWTIFASYGLHWLASKIFGGKAVASRWEHVHRNNARRLVNGFTRLRGVFIKVGQVLSVIGTFLPRAYGEALEKLQDKVPPQPFHGIE